MKRVVMTLAVGVVGVAIGVAMSIPSAYAAGKTKVDCDAVMQELNSGKKAKEVAGAVDENVPDNPWAYIGGAGLMAFLFGYILGRKK